MDFQELKDMKNWMIELMNEFLALIWHQKEGMNKGTLHFQLKYFAGQLIMIDLEAFVSRSTSVSHIREPYEFVLWVSHMNEPHERQLTGIWEYESPDIADDEKQKQRTKKLRIW